MDYIIDISHDGNAAGLVPKGGLDLWAGCLRQLPCGTTRLRGTRERILTRRAIRRRAIALHSPLIAPDMPVLRSGGACCFLGQRQSRMQCNRLLPCRRKGRDHLSTVGASRRRLPLSAAPLEATGRRLLILIPIVVACRGKLRRVAPTLGGTFGGFPQDAPRVGGTLRSVPRHAPSLGGTLRSFPQHSPRVGGTVRSVPWHAPRVGGTLRSVPKHSPRVGGTLRSAPGHAPSLGGTSPSFPRHAPTMGTGMRSARQRRNALVFSEKRAGVTASPESACRRRRHSPHRSIAPHVCHWR